MKPLVILRSIVLFTCLVGILSPTARADTRYVTDQLTITVRSGEGSNYRVLKGLDTGTKVEVLSDDKQTGYSKVRTPDGTVGYSLTRYLIDHPPASVELAALKKKLQQQAQTTPDEAQTKLTDLQKKYQSLKLQYDSLEFENVQLSQQMDAVKKNASNVVGLMDQRDQALQRANKLASQLDKLKVRNTELENHSDKKWFMAGAGVLILGILVGIILPKVGVRRRGKWGSGDFSF